VKSVPASNAISIANPPSSAKLAYPISTFAYAVVPHDAAQKTPLREFITYDHQRAGLRGRARLRAAAERRALGRAAGALLALGEEPRSGRRSGLSRRPGRRAGAGRR
jgi:hypothetical protein